MGITRAFFLILLIIFSPFLQSESEDLHVIVSPSVKTKTLTKLELRSIFTMYKRHWPDGVPVKVFVMPEKSDEHRAFVRSLGLYPYQLKRAWDRMAFSGRATAPQEMKDQESMLKAIAETPGAIGYMQLPADNVGGINVLTVD